MATVLITTSGTGSRLGSITSYTNKSLVPVGNKYTLAHIIDSYPSNTEFVITIGYKGELVREFCSLAYPERKISFVPVDKYEGEGSSLVYSMLQAKSYLEKPFIFHCCDTILRLPLPNFSENTVIVCKNNDFISYSSIRVQGDIVTSMYSKGYDNNDFCYTGVAYYKDTIAFWDAAESLYNSQLTNMSLSDVHCIQEMMKSLSFSYHVTPEFFDTGNPESYSRCQEYFKSDIEILTKNNESLCFLDGQVIKFQADKEINAKRLYRGLSLKPFTPTIIGSTDHFISMEFIKGVLLSESLQYGDILRLLEWAEKNLWVNKITLSEFYKECDDFYITKTLKRLSQLDLSNEHMTVNGISIGPIQELVKSIDMRFLATDTFTQFHGDFILDNIIKTEINSFMLLDWRHEFGKQTYHGDMYYDLAKLRHNIIFNHKNINNKLFEVRRKGEGVDVDLKCNYIFIKQLEDFDSFLLKYNYNKKKVEILTAIVWLNMSPLYENPLRDFLFYFGKLNLYLAISTLRP